MIGRSPKRKYKSKKKILQYRGHNKPFGQTKKIESVYFKWKNISEYSIHEWKNSEKKFH